MAYNSKYSNVINHKVASELSDEEKRDKAARQYGVTDEEIERVFGKPLPSVTETMNFFLDKSKEQPNRYPITIDNGPEQLGEGKNTPDTAKRRPCNNFEWDGEGRGSTKYCKNCNVPELEHHSSSRTAKFNSGKKLASEASEAMDDFEENYPDFFDDQNINDHEQILHPSEEEGMAKECPECKGKSILNNPEFTAFKQKAHCSSCNGKCGTPETNPAFHCKGCQHQNYKCEGRAQEHWGEKDEEGNYPVCNTCGNTGKVDTFTAEPKYKEENDDIDPDLGSFTVDHEDEELPKAETVSPARFEGQSENERLDEPEAVATATEDFRRKTDPNKEYEYAEKPVVTAPAVAKHSPSCSKCGGTGIINDPDEIAKIHDSEGFKQGIKEIKSSTTDPAILREKKNSFLVNQYKCKEGQ